jgi:hypothetical protein
MKLSLFRFFSHFTSIEHLTVTQNPICFPGFSSVAYHIVPRLYGGARIVHHTLTYVGIALPIQLSLFLFWEGIPVFFPFSLLSVFYQHSKSIDH